MPHAKEVAKSIVLEYVEIPVREAVVVYAAILVVAFVLMVALTNAITHAKISAMEIVRAHAKLHVFHLVVNLVWVPQRHMLQISNNIKYTNQLTNKIL